ncbi:hypothetical protein L914_19239 [Phytophthora nicotianae]|uniref:Uncharacterized protein n=1 Tax=Phytophthora nicotianae TaxID=4792 RepID=W2MDF7_PHYNI|nr:hypothetical protein L914_19239 [Phytophthora nicotianae]
MEASSEAGSPTTLLNEEGSAERQSAGRSSAYRNEKEDLLEEKPQLLPMPPQEAPRITVRIVIRPKSLKKKKPKVSRKKLKAPADLGSDSRDEIATT